MKKWKIVSEEELDRLVEGQVKRKIEEMSHSYERELLMKQADIQALQSQINPHFLYNALECIRGQALIEGAEDIADIAEELSSFFRYSISNKGDMVTLDDELENVKSYVNIQKFRFKNKFSFNVQFDEEAERKKTGSIVMPKLVLQPIVENAIIHGFSEMSDGAEIVIRILPVNNNVSILISDNGKGMSQEQLKEVKHRIAAEGQMTGNGKRSHIGVQNVNRRIKLLFGENYGLSINSYEGMGTEVEIFIPGIQSELRS